MHQTLKIQLYCQKACLTYHWRINFSFPNFEIPFNLVLDPVQYSTGTVLPTCRPSRIARYCILVTDRKSTAARSKYPSGVKTVGYLFPKSHLQEQQLLLTPQVLCSLCGWGPQFDRKPQKTSSVWQEVPAGHRWERAFISSLVLRGFLVLASQVSEHLPALGSHLLIWDFALVPLGNASVRIIRVP